jgi:dCTP deaminase
MLLSHDELVELVKRGVITADLSKVNGASIDITLDNDIKIESTHGKIVDLIAKENINMISLNIDNGYALTPGEFILASSREYFNLPDDISCEYKLKSSMARNGLEHLNAGWCDCTWSDSKLTLELKNMTNNHILWLTPGMGIGQMVFFRHEPVPAEKSYAVMGQYNNQSGVTESKGLR